MSNGEENLPPLLEPTSEETVVEEPVVEEECSAEEVCSSKNVRGLTVISPAEFGKRIGPLFGGLFILYLIISGNFVGELFSCELQRMLGENYLIKHMLGIFTLFFFVNLTAGDIPWTKSILAGITVAMYVLFIFSNRTTAHTQLLLIVLLFVIYILQMIRGEQTKLIEGTEHQKHEKDSVAEERDRVVLATNVVAGIILGAIVIGHFTFVGKKRLEFGDKFSYGALWGGTMCRNMDARPYGFGESIKAFFVGAPAGGNGGAKPSPASRPPSMIPSPQPQFADANSWFDNGSGMSEE